MEMALSVRWRAFYQFQVCKAENPNFTQCYPLHKNIVDVHNIYELSAYKIYK